MSALSTFEQVELQEKLAQSSKEIERLNALVAMQAETLKDISGCENDENHIAAISFAQDALSASSETAAKWEAEKLLPLRRQVAMLVHLFAEWRQDHLSDHQLIEAVIATNTQATAEAYDREHAAKVLEEAAQWFEGEHFVDFDCQKYAKEGFATSAEDALRGMSAELRATKVKE